MPTNAEVGVTPLPDGDEVHWSCQELTPEAAQLLRERVAAQRRQSGFANGSALPVRFVSRTGEIIDCYEQCTIHGDDVLCTGKALLPAHSEEQGLELSRRVIHDCATLYHGVYHPYFHPVYLGGRGALPTRRWFVGVLEAARQHGLPSVSADEWLAFNDGRRSVAVEDLVWRAATGDLSFSLRSSLAVSGLTLLLPPCGERVPTTAAVDGQPLPVTPVPYEALNWRAAELGLDANAPVAVSVSYR